MDTLHRTTRYQRLSAKLHKLATGSNKEGAPSSDDIYTSIIDEVNSIIASLRNRGDQSNSKAHFIILTVLMIVVLVWHSIASGGYIGDLIILLLLGAFLFVSQYRMKQVITLSQDNVPKKLEGGTLWYMYFNRSFEIYDDIENTMDFISDKLKVLT